MNSGAKIIAQIVLDGGESYTRHRLEGPEVQVAQQDVHSCTKALIDTDCKIETREVA